MADNETPVVATEAPADIKVEVEEPQQELILEKKLNEMQEHTVKQEETIDTKQDEPVNMKQDEPTDVKQDDSTNTNQEHMIKQEEDAATDVKQEAEVKDETVTDVVMNPKAATDKKTTGGGYKKKIYENKSKFDPTVLPDSEDPGEIRKQVGIFPHILQHEIFYFLAQTVTDSLYLNSRSSSTSPNRTYPRTNFSLASWVVRRTSLSLLTSSRLSRG